jgi:hypothetical protein
MLLIPSTLWKPRLPPSGQEWHWSILRTLLVLFALMMGSPAFADHPTSADPRSQVKVSFQFPDATIKQTTLTIFRCSAILREKPLPKDVWVDDYKIDWWVFAALQDLGLPFKTKTIGKTGGPWKTTIIQIGDYPTGPNGRWVYFVNGARSRYDISTQTDSDLKEIRFVYEPSSSR